MLILPARDLAQRSACAAVCARIQGAKGCDVDLQCDSHLYIHSKDL